MFGPFHVFRGDFTDVSVDTSGLTRHFADLEARQLPFAVANTLNDVAKLAQYRQQQRDRSIFTIRRQDFADRSIKITKFAAKSSLVSTLAVQAPGGGNRSDIFAKFETQTIKVPHGGRAIAIPVAAKRNKLDLIPQNQRPRSFNFHEISPSRLTDAHKLQRHVRGGIFRGALQIFEGDRGTVMIRNANGQGVILQRVGKGKHAGMRVLYYLTAKVRLTPNLNFLETAQEAATHAPEFFRARFAEAMATAR